MIPAVGTKAYRSWRANSASVQAASDALSPRPQWSPVPTSVCAELHRLHHVEGLTYRTIAEAAGVSSTRVHQLVARHQARLDRG